MSITDPISDAITKIRNAYRAQHMNVRVNHCNLVESIVRILDSENFINSFETVERNTAKKIMRKQIYINLRYTNAGEPVLRGIERISKPGRRVYVGSAEVPSVYNNIGVAIISTNRGVLPDREARKQTLGGEYVCKVW
ncbi:MAG: 30S ribosomal protein S8 [Candidatus Cloacimonetes bacterium]|nr:30S ribosomal protein S8 [Candidatus Cloacimonadota bacterium]